jgi:hypothetical protein
VCLPLGEDVQIRGYDSWGDGWGASFVTIVTDEGIPLLEKTKVRAVLAVAHGAGVVEEAVAVALDVLGVRARQIPLTRTHADTNPTHR